MDPSSAVTAVTLPEGLPLGTAFLGIFTLGLMGSLHCAGMCGGLAFRSCQPGKAAGAAYHGSRLMGYMALGAIASSVSAPFVRTQAAQPGVIVGVVVIVTLLWTALSEVTGWQFSRFLSSTPLHKISAFLSSRSAAAPPATRGAIYGLATALLPCGLLYAALLQAASLGHAGYGALAMAIFAGATAPGLWGGGQVVRIIQKTFPRHGKAIAAVLALLVAAIVGWRAFVPKPCMACHGEAGTDSPSASENH